jgi:hypothetical protein
MFVHENVCVTPKRLASQVYRMIWIKPLSR